MRIEPEVMVFEVLACELTSSTERNLGFEQTSYCLSQSQYAWEMLYRLNSLQPKLYYTSDMTFSQFIFNVQLKNIVFNLELMSLLLLESIKKGQRRVIKRNVFVRQIIQFYRSIETRLGYQFNSSFNKILLFASDKCNLLQIIKTIEFHAPYSNVPDATSIHPVQGSVLIRNLV